MALFGSKFKLDRTPVDVTTPPIMPDNVDVRPNDPFLHMPQGLQRPWGDRFKENLPRYASVIGATLQDVGGSINGNYRDALGRLEYQDERDAREKQQAGVYDELSKGIDLDNPYGTLAKAQQAGVSIDGFVEMMRDQQRANAPKTVNTENGAYVVYPDGRQEQIGSDPYADLRGRLLEAQVKAAEALAGQRDNQGDYYAARARQPYAPPRKSTGGGRSTGVSAPSYNPSTVQWD